MTHYPKMVLIGASSRNSGKTSLACSLIKRASANFPVTGLKVTVIAEKNGECPRGGDGCGVCSSLEDDYCITEEIASHTEKDTQKLLKAGAEKVFWLRVLEGKLKNGVDALQKVITADTVIVAESNRLRLACNPSLFIMVKRKKEVIKESAKKVWDEVDSFIDFDGTEFTPSAKNIIFDGNKWYCQISR